MIEWTGGGYVYRAEMSEHLPRPALQAGGPVLTKELDLSDGGGRICAPRSPPPPRCPPTVRPYASGGSTNTSTGSSASPFQVTAWNTGHGDLHWANLTGPELVILDWEGWGRMPTGYDIGLLHALSLTQPATAARIRTEFAHVLESPGGRNGELVALTQLLQVVGRGRHRDLAGRLTGRAQQLTGTPVPTPTA
ncbi:hypothetical protein ACIBBE_42550 [Streptomyces sp. NPDC051644]|uniref:hypothetical protein n=1 Tax=Streptomyces sp. NPDC051644 TaxID=3365666 RepID=UPI0037B7F671